MLGCFTFACLYKYMYIHLSTCPITSTAPVMSIALDISLSEIMLYSGCSNGMIYVWDLSTLMLSHKMKGHTSIVSCLECDKSSVPFKDKILISGSADKTVRCWSISSGKYIATLRGHTGAVKCVAISPLHFISGSADFTVNCFCMYINMFYVYVCISCFYCLHIII
jgi:WD40 repeat protein